MCMSYYLVDAQIALIAYRTAFDIHTRLYFFVALSSLFSIITAIMKQAFFFTNSIIQHQMVCRSGTSIAVLNKTLELWKVKPTNLVSLSFRYIRCLPLACQTSTMPSMCFVLTLCLYLFFSLRPWSC